MSETFQTGPGTDTRPLWLDTAVINKSPQQTGQVNVDVCIVGGGITGLTAAVLLKEAGKSIAIIDIARIGRGESSHTTAHLTEKIDIDYRELISSFGTERAQLACQSTRRAIDRIEENCKIYDIQCGFERVSGYLFTEDHSTIDFIEEESEAALDLGVPNELVFNAPLPFPIQRAMRLDHQAQFNPFQYIAGLTQQLRNADDLCFIFEETRMLAVEEGEPCRVTTDRGTIIADEVFIATNVPSLNRFFLQSKIASYRTYSMAFRCRDSFEFRNLYWDIEDPYHYIRSYEHNGIPYLIVGGEDHKTGQEEHTSVHFQRLEKWARRRFQIESIDYRWSGQIIQPVDGLPYIGRNTLSDHVFVATGYSGAGMTLGTVAGMLVSDMIIGRQNPWVDLYSAGRIKPLASMKSFLSENIDYPSHLISDRFSPPQTDHAARIRENEGSIIRVGAKKVAAYRDPQGDLHLLSPVCPHLGCYVHWNEAEKSWDCPCHGSRFDPRGKLLNGPAVSDLMNEEFEENAPMIAERYDSTGKPSDTIGPPILSLFTCPLKG